MEQRALGLSGLTVSRLGLGTMTWGRDTDEHEAREQLRDFLDAGGTFVDTADIYADGMSERVLGTLVAEVGRDAVVLATKAVVRFGSHRRYDASRGHLLRALDASLDRLGVDHVDLWQLHAWDDATPLDETFAAVQTAVTSGRVSYAGISNYCGWQTAAAAHTARALGLQVVSSQMEYSLLQRGVEREVVPACAASGIGLLPWSPLGRGVLTGKYRHGAPADSRGGSSHFAGFVSPYLQAESGRVVESVCAAAEGLGVAPLDVALAWVRDRPGVCAPIVGARTAAQLRGALASDRLTLPDEIRTALDDISTPAFDYPEKRM